jgi:hypothetical protein
VLCVNDIVSISIGFCYTKMKQQEEGIYDLRVHND